MTFDEVTEHVVVAVEAAGAAIMVLGGTAAFARYGARLLRGGEGAGRDLLYDDLRRDLGRMILLGLEVLIIGDIIRTIVVEPTMANVVVLGGIVLIRIVLSMSLLVEIEGAWPWARENARSEPTEN